MKMYRLLKIRLKVKLLLKKKIQINNNKTFICVELKKIVTYKLWRE